MKRIALLGVAALIAGSAYAAANYEPLTGTWHGTITKNYKDPSGGGTPTSGETGTPVNINFSKSGMGIMGTSIIGDGAKASKEDWSIQGDTYSWNDGEITVTAKAIAWNTTDTADKELLEWAKKETGISPTDTNYVFKYSGCTVNKDKSSCTAGKHLPYGIQQTGLWLFVLKNNALNHHVFYKYYTPEGKPTGGTRHLAENLVRKTTGSSTPSKSETTTPGKTGTTTPQN